MACTACGSILNGIYKHAPMTREQIDDSLNRDREIVIITDANLFGANAPNNLKSLMALLHADVVSEADAMRFTPAFEMTSNANDSDRRHLVTWEMMYAMRNNFGGGLRYLTDGGITAAGDAVTNAKVGSLRSFIGDETSEKGDLNTGCITDLGLEGKFSVSLGQNSKVYGDFSTVAGGGADITTAGNIIYYANSFIGSGRANIIGIDSTENYVYSSNSIIGSGADNAITASNASSVGIFTGTGNRIFGTNAVTASSIVGGSSNELSNTSNSFIGGGNTNVILHSTIIVTCSAIVGGSSNAVYGSYSSILGGYDNKIIPTSDPGVNTEFTSTYAVIGGGSSNRIYGASNYCGVFTGCQNIISGNSQYASISSGYINTISSDSNYTSICSGYSNQITNSHNAVIGSGYVNKMIGDTGTGTYNTCISIVSGSYNTISKYVTNSIIGAGYVNTIFDASKGFIGSGTGNAITQTHNSFIGSGAYNYIGVTIQNGIYASNNAIVSGDQNKIVLQTGPVTISDNINNSFIGGGVQNEILNISGCSIIGGGKLNKVTQSLYAVIGGGYINAIANNSIYSSVVSGYINNIGRDYVTTASFIGGGSFNLINSDDHADGYYVSNAIIGGNANTISDGSYESLIGGGLLNTIKSIRSFIGGGVSNNITNSMNAFIGSSQQSYISTSNESFIGSASRTHIDTESNNSFIGSSGGGYITDSIYAFIGTGGGPIISASDLSFIGTGSSCYITLSERSFIGTGDINYITTSPISFIGSGSGCGIAESNNTFIGSGTANNITSSPYSIIGSGSNCYIATSDNSFISSGYVNNITSSNRSSIIGGTDNRISESPNSGIYSSMGCYIQTASYSVMLGCSGSIIPSNYSNVALIACDGISPTSFGTHIGKSNTTAVSSLAIVGRQLKIADKIPVVGHALVVESVDVLNNFATVKWGSVSGGYDHTPMTYTSIAPAEGQPLPTVTLATLNTTSSTTKIVYQIDASASSAIFNLYNEAADDVPYSQGVIIYIMNTSSNANAVYVSHAGPGDTTGSTTIPACGCSSFIRVTSNSEGSGNGWIRVK